MTDDRRIRPENEVTYSDREGNIRRQGDGGPDDPSRSIEIPPLLPDQAEYLKRIHDQAGKYDPKVRVGGPDKGRGNSQ